MSLASQISALATRIGQELKSIKINYLLSSAYTAADILTKIKTVDGTGSGLDADFLDGQHGGYYAPLASPTFTGTVGGITKTMVGLGSVDNTADTAKPVSTAQQTALNLKANLASPALTGSPTVNAKAIVVTDDSRLSDARTPTDLSLTYDKVATSLKTFAGGSSTIQLSNNGGATITLPANTAFTFFGFELNKSYLMIITANGFMPSWAQAAKHVAVEGNASFGTSGVFYVNLTCIDATSGSEKLLTTIMKGV